MGLKYLNFCSYWKNLTSPLTCWHRGTAFQFDVMKDHQQMPVVLTDLGTDVVIVTMAARIMQSIISLAKNLLQKRPLCWKMLPRVWVSKALRAVVWLCWNVLDLLLPLLMTTVYVYKNHSRIKAVCNTEQPMNTVSIQCHWRSKTEPENMIVEELCSLKMANVQEVPKMEVDCKSEELVNKQVLLSCTNKVILSMICMPSEHMDSSEESEVGSIDVGLEDMSVDSGMQESWTPKSKYEEDGGEESDWSDEDSWDEESNSCNDNEDLWASFCRSDDPYNPLSFTMPSKSPEQSKKKASMESLVTCQNLINFDCTDDLKTEFGTATEKLMRLCKKPMLSGYKSSHKCTLPKDEATEGDQRTKKVRFSPKVAVRPIITWSFAHRMARKGPWEECARDRSRFQRRIAETEATIGFCLDPHHREKIWAGLYSEQN